ncbi:MAG TPA: copper resistance CopC family protein [Gammaproteobacteria bacterium]|nr:copper resistance CopC family protein [Gammaproteobacteria bacterium]
MTWSSFTAPERIPAIGFLGILLILGLLAHTKPAFAHAIVVESTPAVNAEVGGPDVHIDLRFNSRIDHARSRLILTDAAGHKVRVTIPGDAPADHILTTVKGVAPGKCTLEWRVLSVDGHLTRGLIPFTVTVP